MVLSSSANLHIKSRMSSMYNCDSLSQFWITIEETIHISQQKLHIFTFFCGLRKLNTLNLRLFHTPLNSRNHFSTVLIKTNWYTTSCKYGGCKSLTSINIPNSVTNIGDWAFERCESLTNINIPNSVTNIGNHAFWGCKSLTSINIPNSVTYIGNSAFGECSSLPSKIKSDIINRFGPKVFE